MERERSPRYPGVPLATAVENVTALVQRRKQKVVTPEEAVDAWGFKALSGPARSRLGALRQYGLLQPENGGLLRITDLGMTLALRERDSDDYMDAVKQAALMPPLFKELWDTKQDVSDDALRLYLLRSKDFSHDGASRLVSAYRTTISYANLAEGEQPGGDDDMVNLDDLRGKDHHERREQFHGEPSPNSLRVWLPEM